MTHTLTITISTSTDTTGDAIELIEGHLSDIVDKVDKLEEGKQYVEKTGDIESLGYEVLTHYRIVKEQ
jgi:hypothetical protein